ncbi:hypothetical protein MCOR25_010516 [Pyricularia grisea]|nr:hypothetical protein MCOR25_010516 [Pyricularia grisea]
MTELYSLKGKNVVITGAGGSIGTQTAILFAKSGASTLLLSDVSQSALDALRCALARNGPFPDSTFIFHACDVSDDGSMADLFSQLDPLGGPDVVVNNAGVFPTSADGDAITSTRAAWDTTYRVNVLGTWLGCRYAVLAMRRHAKPRGSVVNLGSVAGLIGSATAQLAYTSSKGAVAAITRELAIIHARKSICFNCLCPGPVNSPMLNHFLDGPGDEEEESAELGGEPNSGSKRRRREVHLPQGRWGESVEVAAAALFLAADASAFVNAIDLAVDGGLTKAFVTPLGPPSAAFIPNFSVSP